MSASVLEVQGTDLYEGSEQSEALHWLPELPGELQGLHAVWMKKEQYHSEYHVCCCTD